MLNARILKTDLPFLLLFAIFAISYYDSVLDKGPVNVHLWRQADCLSMTENYADGADFAASEMHIQLGDDKTSGLSVGEFPILYYTVGNLWKLTGKSHLVYRLVYLAILFAGIFAFYRALFMLLKSKFWAMLLSLLLFTSPVYVVYGVSFLSDGPALSFVLIALYFMTKYRTEGLIKSLYFAALFFALAGLVKVSSMIAFVFLGGILVIETVRWKTLGKQRLFFNLKHGWIAMLLVILSVFAWYYYASVFNGKHGFKYTFNHIWPLWRMNWGEIVELTTGIKNFTSHIFFSRPMIYVLILVGLINLALRKQLSLLAYLSNIGIILGAGAYFILWAPLLGNHDYYYVALLILFVGIMVPFMTYLLGSFPEVMKSNWVRGFAFGFLAFNFFYCTEVTQLKTIEKNGKQLFPTIGNTHFISHLAWMNTVENDRWQRFERMRPYLKELGIKKEDLVISFPDESFNISLYMVGQKGWTNFQDYFKKEQVAELVKKGAKYLFLSEPELKNQSHIQPFTYNLIGEFEGIEIYRFDDREE